MSPAERTGRTRTRIAEYASIDHTNSGMRMRDIPRVRSRQIVTRKLIAPMSDAIERTWIERIHRSWPFPAIVTESGT